MAVSNRLRGCGYYRVVARAFIVLLSTITAAGVVCANPTGGQVTSGSATIVQTPGHTQINQASDKAIINWQSFNIAPNESTHFQQPSSSSMALNRINPGQGASQIYGSLTSNGRIILINQAGIYFGPTAYVNVGGIVASTRDISDQNFLAGKLSFDQPSLLHGTVINQGTIIAANHGLVALIGSNVSNEGYIQANSGSVVLASGNKFTVDLNGDGLINFSVDEASTGSGVDQNGNKMKNGVSNSGTVIADAGKILMTAKDASGVVDRAINMTGVAQARSVSQANGEIIFASEDEGIVEIAGKIDATGEMINALGGKIKALGVNVHVASNAVLDASGYLGGGEILIGGNYQGKGPERNALTTVVDSGATLKANAITKGKGGKVIVWADGYTGFHGVITAQGGALGGDGGFVETSGHYLNIAGAKVSTFSSKGATGQWLLDPSDLTISAGTTTASVSGTTYSNNSSNSVLNVSDLTTALASNNIIVLTTTTGTGGNGDIFVNTDINWSSGNTLTLSAYRSINVAANIINTGGASVVLQADNVGDFGSSLATVAFSSGKNVTLSGGVGTVSIYYNPVTFGTPETIYTGGTTPTAYMLINQLGSESDTTTPSLASLSNTSSMWDKNFALSKDIDASATSSWNANTGINAIGTTFTDFSGQFDGQYHAISGLFKSEANLIGSASGFFGSLIGTVQNLTLVNLNFSAPQFNIVSFGGLAGVSTGTITNVGIINPTLSSISNFNGIGGLVGRANGGSISNSYVLGGTVSENNISGTNGTIIGAGGLVGLNVGSIQDSYSTATVIGYNIAGGLVGFNNTGSITNSFSTGAVSVTDIPTDVGGLVGENNSTVDNSFWDTTTSGQATSAGGTGQTTTQMQTQSTFTTAGWDFTTTPIWNIVDGSTYPFIAATQLGVTGTVNANAGGTLNSTAISFATGGDASMTATTNGSGSYTLVLPKNLPILAFASGTGNLLFNLPLTSNTNLTGVDITANQLTIQQLGGYVLSNANASFARGSSALTGTLYTASGNDLTISSALSVLSPFTLNGSITSTGNQSYSNTLALTADVTLTSSGGVITFGNAISGEGKNLTLVASNVTLPSSSVSLNNLTLTGSGGSSTLSIPVGNLNWIISGANSGTVSGYSNVSGTLSFSNMANLIGSSGTNSFVLNGGTLSGSITGLSNANTLTADNVANTWVITGANTGTVTGITSGFSNIQNVTGGSSTDNFTLNGGTLSGALSGGGGTNTLTADNVANTWVITGANTGTVTGITSGFSNIQNVTGGSSTDNFTLNGGTLSGALSGGGGTDTLTADNVANTWVITGTNTGTVTGITSGFSNIQNVTGGSSTDNFTLNGGTLSGALSGGSGTNTLVAANVANTWVITGTNTGTVTGITSGFSNIQNLTGGSSTNNFTFNNGTSISGLIDGSTGTSSLDYSSYPVAIVLASTNGSGNALNNSSVTVATFQNINDINNASSIQTANKVNSIYITSGGSGYINDPVNFTGTGTIYGNSTTSVTFNTPTTLNRSTGVATINGYTMQFVGIPSDAYFGSIISNTPTQSSTTETTLTASQTSAINSVTAQTTQNQSNVNQTTQNSDQTTTSSSNDQSTSSSTTSSSPTLATSAVIAANQSISTTTQQQTQTDTTLRDQQQVSTGGMCGMK